MIPSIIIITDLRDGCIHNIYSISKARSNKHTNTLVSDSQAIQYVHMCKYQWTTFSKSSQIVHLSDWCVDIISTVAVPCPGTCTDCIDPCKHCLYGAPVFVPVPCLFLCFMAY